MVVNTSPVDLVESREFRMNEEEFGKFFGEITERGFKLETRVRQLEPRRSNVLVITHPLVGDFGHGMIGDYNYGRDAKPSYFFETLKYPVACMPEAKEAHQQLMESFYNAIGRKIVWD